MTTSQGKVVAVTIASKSAKKWSTLLAPAPLKHAHTHMVIKNASPGVMEEQITKGLRMLKDGDILVFNSHANEDYFVYGHANKKVDWSDIWKHFAVKNPPRLSAVIIASCMAPRDKKLSRSKLRDLNAIFNSGMIVAPHSTYEYHFFGGTKDNRTADNIIADILLFAGNEISRAEFNQRIHRDQDRFAASYGCNGWNHPGNCRCRFGPNASRDKKPGP